MEWAMDFWHWWVLAVVLIIAEVFLPSFIALWLGIAAAITGFILLLFPQLAVEFQLLLFAVMSVLSIVAGRNYYRKHPIKTDEPTLNRRGEQYVGRIITLTTPIVDGEGKVKIDDSTWKIIGPDCPAGTQIRMIALKNVIFEVELAD